MRAPIDVIIVNYNAGEALSACVASVLAQDIPVRMTIVDNASSDTSARRLRARYGHLENLSLVESGVNRGFAGGVNFALDQVDPGGEYLLILNPDCEMLPGSLGELAKALEQEPRAALAGPLVVNREGKPQRGTLRSLPDPWKSFVTFSGLWRLGRRFRSFKGVDLSRSIPDTVTEAEAVSGACMLLRKAIFLQIGGMDEAYGLHCEDLDLMYRLQLQGRPCVLVPTARVFHSQGVSSRSRPLWAYWQKHRGMQRFFLKHQARRYPLPLRWLVVGGIWIRFVLTLPLALVRV